MKDDVLKSAATAGILDSFRGNYQANLRVTGSEFMRHSLEAAKAKVNVPIRKHKTIAIEPL